MTQFVKIVPTKDTKFILVCAHANRTKVVANFLSKELGYTNVNELDGGINYGWIDKGLKTVK
jgi:rhodanese-related sulfurtransferase